MFVYATYFFSTKQKMRNAGGLDDWNRLHKTLNLVLKCLLEKTRQPRIRFAVVPQPHTASNMSQIKDAKKQQNKIIGKTGRGFASGSGVISGTVNCDLY